MTKHDTILATLRALTGARTLATASRKLAVIERIELPTDKHRVSCELCGTSFLRGAWLRPMGKSTRIAVGGTCLKSIIQGQFGASRDVRARQRSLTQTIERRYLGAIDPGNWIKWIIDSAPSEYAALVVQLDVLRATRNEHDLRRLLDFHDGSRKFVAEAFFPNADLIREQSPLPESLTIVEARHWKRELHESWSTLRLKMARRAAKHSFDAFLENSGAEVRTGWNRLGKNARDTIHALVALHEVERGEGEPVCPKPLASEWPPLPLPLHADAYVWHPWHGLAWVDAEGDIVSKCRPWLWETGTESSQPISLRDWHKVAGGPRARLWELVESRVRESSGSDEEDTAELSAVL